MYKIFNHALQLRPYDGLSKILIVNFNRVVLLLFLSVYQ